MKRVKRVTCADRIILAGSTKNAYCAITETQRIKGTPVAVSLRCINIPADKCRMKPIDVNTGKPVKRKFVVPKEGVKAKWWKEVKETDKHGKALLLQKDRKATRKGLSKRGSL